ncbi:sensor histidine kinase [Streptomyces sp. NBC_01304]|uniref:sensor histidine kinase n=1 Tax=Streptomyces sp. NBC_01304 TaxID=2903818 RepID=UPI002E0EB185|nr:HAMP domain-containing histidine kinase [Streptomyces sp. NBC_01304]
MRRLRRAAPASPAVARLRRTRRLMTLLFAATTAACLLVLATIAVRIDAGSRSSGLDHEVSSRAAGLARSVWFDAGVLHLEPLEEDELAQGAQVLAVLQVGPGKAPLVRTAVPARSALPDGGELGRVWADVLAEQETVVFSADSRSGRQLRWAAAPVWDDDRIGAAVLVGTGLARSERDHALLVRWLALGCAALVCCAAAVGHLLSGRAMRPAVVALAQQEQFLAEAAHELRTPLTTLRLAVEAGSSPGEAVRLVDRLSRLVTGLLARARMEAGGQRPELLALRLDQLVETTVAELPDHDRVRVRTEPVVVLGDPDLLAQAVLNLVENAQRYGGPADSPVEVTVAPGLVTVRDHGPGVPVADRERVFSRGVTEGSLGTGTGLAIVRWVAELHGGSARLTDAPGGGLLAELRLPVRPGSPSSSSSHEGSGTVGA